MWRPRGAGNAGAHAATRPALASRRGALRPSPSPDLPQRPAALAMRRRSPCCAARRAGDPGDPVPAATPAPTSPGAGLGGAAHVLGALRAHTAPAAPYPQAQLLRTAPAARPRGQKRPVRAATAPALSEPQRRLYLAPAPDARGHGPGPSRPSPRGPR